MGILPPMRFYKHLFIAGLPVYFVQLVFAIVFFKERVVLPDDANYLFDLVSNGGRFAIFHQRFIAVFTQWLPYTAIQLGQPLDIVASLYSLNVSLFYFICYLICGLCYRNYKAALALLLSGMLFSTFTFYWMASELPQAIALFFVLFAMLSHEEQVVRKPGLLQLLVLAGIMLTVAFAHALMLFLISFLLLFLWLDNPDRRRQLIIAGGAYVGALILKAVFRDEYDDHALGGLRNFVRLFPDYLGTESMTRFLTLCVGKYCWIPIVLVLNIAWYIRSRSWLKLALLVCYFLGYLLLTTITFPNVDGHDFYQENLYLPLGVFLAVPLVYDVLPRVRPAYLAVSIVALILGSGLLRIWQAHKPFTARLAWQRSIIRQYDGRKVILNEQAFPKDTLMMAWSSPYEFWLLSTLEEKKTASILITPAPEKYVGMTDSRAFLPTFSLYNYSDLPAPYFMFKDTVNVYEWVR